MNLNNMNYFNYLYQMGINSNCNNLYMNNNKKYPSNFNQNINNINNKNLYDLKIEIDTNILMKLGRNYLIDIILFLRDICEIKIPSETSGLKHEIFNVKRIGKKCNNYKFYIKANFRRRFKYLPDNKIMEKIDDLFDKKESKNNNNNSEDENNNNTINDIDKNENIINENKIIDEKSKNKISNIFFCDVHNKIFISKDDHEAHIKTHKKCSTCGMEFKYKNELKNHRKIHINNNNNNIYGINKNINSNNDHKIKCIKCELFFESIELMTEHFYKTHEKIQNEQIKKNEEPKINEKIELKNEQNQKQDEIKKEEENNIDNNKKIKKHSIKKDEPKFIKDNFKAFGCKRKTKYGKDEN